LRRLVPIANVLFALLLAMAGLSLALLVVGRRPDTAIVSLFGAAFASRLGFSETLLRTVPVLLCALAAAIPAQSGQINIGGEGQLHLGAIGAALAVGVVGGSGVIVPAMVLGAILFGGIWALIPAVLRVRPGVNEALVTLFLNYVAISLLQYLVHGPMRDPASYGWPMSAPLPQTAILTPMYGTRLHWGVVVVLIVAVVIVAGMRLTRTGVELRTVGLNVRTASLVRIPVRWYWFGSLVCGGILAGLAGYYEIAGVQHRLRTDISLGFGYSGFLVAWMCRRQLWLIFPISVLVSGLISSSDSLQIMSGLPAASADVVQGLLLLFVLLGQSALAKWEQVRAVRQILQPERE
jgi:ABC-type uncharacterized transport system permease subunit